MMRNNKYLIKKLRQVYLQVFIPKIIKPYFGDEMRIPKLIFINRSRIPWMGMTTGHKYIFINMYYAEIFKTTRNNIICEFIYALCHECVHNIQRVNQKEYNSDIDARNYIEKECDDTTTNIMIENKLLISRVCGFKIETDQSKFKDDIRNQDIDYNMLITDLSRIINTKIIKNVDQYREKNVNIIINGNKYHLIENGKVIKKNINTIVDYGFSFEGTFYSIQKDSESFTIDCVMKDHREYDFIEM